MLPKPLTLPSAGSTLGAVDRAQPLSIRVTDVVIHRPVAGRTSAGRTQPHARAGTRSPSPLPTDSPRRRTVPPAPHPPHEEEARTWNTPSPTPEAAEALG